MGFGGLTSARERRAAPRDIDYSDTVDSDTVDSDTGDLHTGEQDTDNSDTATRIWEYGDSDMGDLYTRVTRILITPIMRTRVRVPDLGTRMRLARAVKRSRWAARASAARSIGEGDSYCGYSGRGDSDQGKSDRVDQVRADSDEMARMRGGGGCLRGGDEGAQCQVGGRQLQLSDPVLGGCGRDKCSRPSPRWLTHFHLSSCKQLVGLDAARASRPSAPDSHCDRDCVGQPPGLMPSCLAAALSPSQRRLGALWHANDSALINHDRSGPKPVAVRHHDKQQVCESISGTRHPAD